MRVLAVHPGADRYGADLMLVRSLAALRERSHDVILLVPEDGPLVAAARALGAEVWIEPVTVLRKSLLRPAALAREGLRTGPELLRMRRLLAAVRPDLVYVSTVTLPHWSLAARLLSGHPVVCHVRELEEGLPRRVNRALLAPLVGSRMLVANSSATADFLTSHWPVLRARTRVIYNGFEPPPPLPPPTVGARARIALVGRLSPRKGQDLAVAAVARLVREGRDLELHLIGTSFRGYEWFEHSLREQADRLGIADRVVLRGYVADVLPEFAAADVALVPSRLEPFGNVAVEAQLAGCPVVVTRVGGLPEIVQDGANGLLVPPDSAADLAGALGRLLDDPMLVRRMREHGYRDAVRRFGLDRYGQELVAALEQAARGSGRRGTNVAIAARRPGGPAGRGAQRVRQSR